MVDSIKHIFTLFNKDKIVKDFARKEKGIIVGGQALKQQLGVTARPSDDYDILVSKPSNSAKRLERVLNKESESNNFYTRPSKYHPSTVKVLDKGFDGRRNTKDDIELVDFSPLRKVKTINIKGNRYADLSSVKKEKMQILKDKKYKFRHAKDKEDINRIDYFNRLWWL